MWSFVALPRHLLNGFYLKQKTRTRFDVLLRKRRGCFAIHLVRVVWARGAPVSVYSVCAMANKKPEPLPKHAQNNTSCAPCQYFCPRLSETRTGGICQRVSNCVQPISPKGILIAGRSVGLLFFGNSLRPVCSARFALLPCDVKVAIRRAVLGATEPAGVARGDTSGEGVVVIVAESVLGWLWLVHLSPCSLRPRYVRSARMAAAVT